ncbi:MAG: TldD/PmbA family protein [Bacteroidota bacterium]|nr:TldD/PmbA family protein [Bacteroidota bacterium]MDP4229680.1 TldD/PmbA family protein [Bacteroidota bacterium]MDP4235054.1 TldD/PmbA family protein [Bacteroidota bacterium]
MAINKDILTSSELEALSKKVIGFSKSEWCEVNIDSAHSANLRYAANMVTTSGSAVNTTVNITCANGKKSGTVTTNDLSNEGLSMAVKRAEEIASLAPDNEELMPPLAEKPKYLRSAQFDESSADTAYAAGERAKVAEKAIKEAKARQFVTAGFLETIVSRFAMRNSKGVYVDDQKTRTTFSTTMRNEDGSSSGWNKSASQAIARLNPDRTINRAAEKCEAWSSPKEMDPGVYKTILEPSAAADLVQQFIWSLNAREAEEGRSAFSRPGGGTALGEQLFSDKISISSNPNHPLVPSGIFDRSGLATEQVDWVKNGKITNFERSRFWAQKTGKKPVPGPSNIIMDSGSQLPEDFLATAKPEGLLITSFWYIRDVDNQTLLKTGLTRDGLFWVENGEIKHGVVNFRWNESPITVLKNVTDMSKAIVTAPRDGWDGIPMLIPMLVVSGFNYSSISDAV